MVIIITSVLLKSLNISVIKKDNGTHTSNKNNNIVKELINIWLDGVVKNLSCVV